MDGTQATTTPRAPGRLLGRTLHGRYAILDVLGTGGMATVFRARDLRLERLVALKVLHSRLAADPDFLERFHREAAYAARLSSHPYIVAIHDVGNDGSVHYIVMELVEGRTLAELIAREAPLSVERSFDLGRQIALALDFAHRHDLVHRDVKPQNVLVCPDGRVKVTDFGIARAAGRDQLTRTGIVLGSAHYLSPEQAQRGPIDARSDLYSLGVILYEMLAGRRPFDGDSPVAIALQRVNEAPPSPRIFNSRVPDEAVEVVMRALNRRPEDRYPSAAAFAVALEQAGASVAPRVAPAGSPDGEEGTVAAPLRSRRFPARRAALILPLLALVCALGAWAALRGTGDEGKNAPGSGAASRQVVSPPRRFSRPASVASPAAPRVVVPVQTRGIAPPTSPPTMPPTSPPTMPPTSLPTMPPTALPTVPPAAAPAQVAPPQSGPPDSVPPGYRHGEKRGFDGGPRGDRPNHGDQHGHVGQSDGSGDGGDG